MYKKLIMPLLMLLCPVLTAGAQGLSLHELLLRVEQNNVSLQAASESVKAQSLEARMGNSLDDLSISYKHLWGNQSQLGTTGELEITQEFQFPTVYARRNRQAGNLASQYENQYLDLRQQTLLKAKELYIELQVMYKMDEMVKLRLAATGSLRKLYDKRFETGDATRLDKIRADNEYLLLQETAAEYALRIAEISRELNVLAGGEALEIPIENYPLESVGAFDEVLSHYETYAPGLLAFKLEEKGAENDVKLSRSQAIPKIELGYVHEYGSVERERFNGAVMGLSVPIFSNRHNVKRAKAAQTAAALETNAAVMECSETLREMYAKLETLAGILGEYDDAAGFEEFCGMLGKALATGEISISDYYAELSSFHNMLEAKYRLEMEYRLTAARINMIYL